jgi:rare lipoprotein A
MRAAASWSAVAASFAQLGIISSGKLPGMIWWATGPQAVRFSTIHPTAAHRSLPLASLARVTNLDNGRSVIVKINDRGPYTRGRILDVSPRAADALDMKRAGVAAVAVEPLVNQEAPTVAVVQASDTSMAQ